MASGFDPRAYVPPSPVPWLIHALTPVTRAMLAGPLKLRELELPAADHARLAAALNRDTAAFVGPNHPEFTTDWLLDKELSARLSPLMAHWASYEIVNASPAAQRFWLANNLISNAPGGNGKAHSVRWALEGHGVLLHPEGTATWQAERVAPLLPGIVDMAIEAAAQGTRPVFVVPVVWRSAFVGDAWRALGREMGILERALRLGSGEALAEDQRFARLLSRTLRSRAEMLGLPAPACDPERPGRDYFAAQARQLAAVRAALEARHGPLDADIARAQHAVRKSMRERAAADPEGTRLDRARLAELQRLAGLDPRLYDRPAIGPEAVAENLKRLRAALVTRGLRHVLHNTLPIAVAPRTMHLRAPEPIDVRAQLARRDTSPADAASALLALLRGRLQRALDGVSADLEPRLARFRRANPLASGG